MKRISKLMREEAALVCAVAASSGRGSSAVAADLGIDFDRVGDLIKAAFVAAEDKASSRDDHGFQDWPAQMAEAEALIRTGWSPGDEP